MNVRPFRLKKISDYFWLAIILHVLLFFLFSTLVIVQREEKKSPKLYVPAYVFKGSITPPKLLTPMNSHSIEQSQPVEPKPQTETKTITKAIALTEAKPVMHHMPSPKSLIADSFALLDEHQMTSMETATQKYQEPIYLIGDESTTPDPLIKLIGRSLSAHFDYPRMAGELGIKGKVLIGLTIHPQGFFSDVQMLRSSGNQDLDNAALTAVNLAPRVEGADRFLSAPKHLVVGFIFKLR